MEIAISLSDTLFEKAEQTARYMGVSKDHLLSIALEEYIARHNGEIITKKLNKVYEKINQDEFKRNLDVGLESLRNLTKDDAW
jgi:hypothetical protein